MTFNPLRKLLKASTLLFGILVIFLVITVSYIYSKAPVRMLKDVYPMVRVLSPQGEFNIIFRHNKPYNWTSIENISPYVVSAIVVSEDWAFYDHNGVDFSQLYKAVRDKINKNKSLRGASTISQQTIKNLFFDNSRSFIRKFKELIYTIKFEQNFSKKKILEFYLNIVEFDRNIFGIYTASYHYFNKHPKNLNAREGAFLAMVLPSPKKYSISFRDAKVTPFASGVIDSILIKMRQAKVFTESERKIQAAKRFNWESKSSDEDTHNIQQ